MGTYPLTCHPQTPAKGIHGVEVRWYDTGKGQVILRYQVNGVDALAVPAFSGKGRGDRLWETTCCELFLKDAGGNGYIELNFSPSGRWAAYRFADYREAMVDPEVPLVDVGAAGGQFVYVLTATLDAAILADASAAGLSAVIEETDGTKSYWALAHPAGNPDFHHPAYFVLPLPAPGHP